jgi:hypothetical protein
MKIKMLVSISGTIDGQPWAERGEHMQVADVVALDLISNKYAEAVDEAETSSIDPVAETAAKPTAKPRKV